MTQAALDPPAFEPEIEPLGGGFDPGLVLDRLRDLRGLCALDSSGGHPRRHSWIAFEPWLDCSAPAERGEPAAPRSIREVGALVAAMERRGAVPGPFQGGFLGAFGYDLGIAGASLQLPSDPLGSPAIAGGLYTDFIVCDHASGTASLVLGRGDAIDRDGRRARVMERLDGGPRSGGVSVGPVERRTSPAEHMARIARVREDIAAGEYYQANLSHRFSAPFEGDPLDIYLALREQNPAPYSGFLRFHGGALLCTSPELLVELRGGRARSVPIKGTAPRPEDPAADAAAAEALSESAKDRAELAMIVDLVRNDLGRVARTGTVEVGPLPELQSFARVHHLVACVSAELDAGRTPTDLLEALFPGGSITGAPKQASCLAIARLEGEGRGFFTGSMGYLDTAGSAAFNILIRTVVARGGSDGRRGLESAGELSLHVGGGITWGSDPAAEDRETLDKAAAILDVLAQLGDADA